MVDQRVDAVGYWTDPWKDILAGGAQRWKDGEQDNNFMTVYSLLASEGCFPNASNVLVPLCGDCPFTWYAHSQGHSVVCVDAVDMALEKLQGDFKGLSFSKQTQGDTKVSTSDDNKVQMFCGSIFASEALWQLKGSMNVVYDKDAFGAIDPSQRNDYARIIGELASPDAFVFVEGKDKEGELGGPPFHLSEAVIQEAWGKEGFKLMKHFPSVYPLGHPKWKQQGFLLQRSSSL